MQHFLRFLNIHSVKTVSIRFAMLVSATVLLFNFTYLPISQAAPLSSDSQSNKSAIEKQMSLFNRGVEYYDIAGCSETTSGTPSSDVVDGSLQQLAKQILEDEDVKKNVSFWVSAPESAAIGWQSRVPNGGNKTFIDTRDVVVALSQGKKAYTTAANAPNAEADLNPNILKFIIDAAKGGNKIMVNALTDRSHSSGSNHYKGLAIDLDLNSAPVSALNPIAEKYGGVKNNESDHHHYDFLERPAKEATSASDISTNGEVSTTKPTPSTKIKVGDAFKGKATNYGSDPVTHYVDPGDANDPYTGISNDNPGIAVYNYGTAKGYWLVTTNDNRSAILQQTDVGPGAAGAFIDINTVAVRSVFGMEQGNSFEGKDWTFKYLGEEKPAGAITKDSGKKEDRTSNGTDIIENNKPADQCTCTTNASLSTPDTKDVNGNVPQDVMKAINKLKPAYQEAEKATGVPWQAIAAIHYRESSNSESQDLQAGNAIGGPYGQYSDSYGKYGYPKSMGESAIFAAKELMGKTSKGKINVPSPDPDILKDAFFGYNGRASVYAAQAAQLGFDADKQPYEGSPYVMNNFDAKHKNMGIITQDFGGLDGTDTRLGAYTLYVRLGGGSGFGDSCNSVGNGTAESAVALAVKYSWPDYHKGPYTAMKDEYKAAIDKAIANDEYVGGDDKPGIDCGGFITRVMRDSGADPNYNEANGPTTAQQKYMDDHPEKYEKLGVVVDSPDSKLKPGDLQPGDIAIHSAHTFMFVGNQPGFHGLIASASISPKRSPMAGNLYFSDSVGDYTWYRLKSTY
jgi:hypothetical protein